MKAKLGIAMAVVWFVSASARGAFTTLVDFGDSLSDVGNAYAATGGTLPAGPGYSAGRFSNGNIWLQGLSTKLGTAAVTASTSGGSDYAYGGTTSGTGFTAGVFPNIRTQINGWTAGHTGNSSQLFTVLGGANDLFDIIDGSTTTTTAASAAADNIAGGVSALYAAGARNVLVVNLPDLGKSPKYRTTASSTNATNQTVAFNNELAGDLTSLQSTSPGLNLFRVDLFALVNSAVASPATYGLTNVTDPAYTGDTGYAGNGTSVANPSGYLFWDQVHPTTTGHGLLANAAFASVPEPATMGMMIIGLSMALLRRNGRKDPV